MICGSCCVYYTKSLFYLMFIHHSAPSYLRDTNLFHIKSSMADWLQHDTGTGMGLAVMGCDDNHLDIYHQSGEK